jgi:hypothetical protein
VSLASAGLSGCVTGASHAFCLFWHRDAAPYCAHCNMWAASPDLATLSLQYLAGDQVLNAVELEKEIPVFRSDVVSANTAWSHLSYPASKHPSPALFCEVARDLGRLVLSSAPEIATYMLSDQVVCESPVYCV